MSFMMAMPLTEAKCSNGSSVPIQEPKTSVPVPNLPSKSSEEGLSVRKFENQEAPSLMKIVSELQSLSTVMQTFHCRWDELQKHLDFIETAVGRREKQLTTLLPIQHPKNTGTNIASHDGETASLTAKESAGSDIPSSQSQESEKKVIAPLSTGNSSESYLESLCRSMSSRELRKHIVTHISEVSKLRHEVPAALKSAPNPAKLVFQCIGRFFLQGRKAFTKNSAMITSRLAALLILEYFLLAECHNKFEQSIKQETEQAALAWRKRLIAEGGVFNAGHEDAKGLLLLVACFGIPDVFTVDDLIYLLRLSSVHDISEALRKSSFLLTRMPDIIECMKNKGMDIEAVDVVYTFGVDDKFSPRILTPFLKSLKETCKKARNEAKGSPFLLKEANQKQLTVLKSLMKCLEFHKIDPAEVIPGWKLNEKITNLEKDIAELGRKIAFKRKAEQTVRVANDQDFKETVRFANNQDFKQTVRVANDRDFKRQKVIGEALVPIPSPFSSLQEPRATDQPVYQLGSRYPDPAYSSSATSSWPPGYNAIGFSGRVGVPGASLGPSFSSGSTLPPTAVPSVGLPIPSSERSVERSYIGSSGTAELGSHAYVGSSSLFGGFQGIPNTSSFGAATRTSASDLYHFADTVSESDYARSSRGPGNMPAPTSYRSSFL